jgi:hypothetical protein
VAVKRVPGTLIQVVLIALLVAIPVHASAQGAPTVTLEASDKQFNFGKTTTLSGETMPATAGQEIHIVDEDGSRVATTQTNNSGRFSVKLTPRSNVTVRAEWAGTFSDAVPLKVRPILKVNLGTVRLFDRAGAWGHIAPANVPGKVTLQLRKWGKVLKTTQAKVNSSGWFKKKFYVEKPGGFKVTAVYRDGDHLPATAGSKVKETPMPNLSSGSNSPYVKLLEQRLRKLKYKVPKPNNSFDYRTSDNVIAFNKVQGRSRVGYVNDSTWRALASPKTPKPKFSWPKYHIEVDQSKQVLYRVKNNEVITIMHVSTGAGGTPTRDGTFNFDSKLAGYSRKRLYYPSFFDGARAIHGWPEVPTYNASHGCVRVPMWQATWIFSKIEIGQLIRVYH